MKLFINIKTRTNFLFATFIYFTNKISSTIQPSPSFDEGSISNISRKNHFAQNKNDCDKNIDIHSKNESSFCKYATFARQLDSIEIYFVIWDKDAKKLTGIVSNNIFDELDNQIKHQQRVISVMIPFFELKNETSFHFDVNTFKLNLHEIIISFKKILQIWNLILNEIESNSLIKKNAIDKKIKDIKVLMHKHYKDGSNKENEPPKSTFFMSANSLEREFNNISTLMNNCENLYGLFKEEKIEFIIEYISSFEQTISEIINKLQVMSEEITAFGLEIILEAKEYLKKIFNLFDENKEDTFINLVKKINEMNVYLCEELERYDKKYFGFLKKLDDLSKKAASSDE